MRLFNLFKKKWKPKFVWLMENHRGWGNAINWFDDYVVGKKIQRIHGHLIGIEEGDELRCQMESGKIARFRIINLEYMTDPTDQFFADAKYEGYLE